MPKKQFNAAIPLSCKRAAAVKFLQQKVVRGTCGVCVAEILRFRTLINCNPMCVRWLGTRRLSKGVG